jgi:hypothetical protein
MSSGRPSVVKRDLALFALLGAPFLTLWNWVGYGFWSEGPTVMGVWLTVQVLWTGYFVLLVFGLCRGHRWVWHVLSKGRWNPLGSRRYHEPEVRDYFGIK